MTDNPEFVENPLRISCADAIELMTHFLDDALSSNDLADFEIHLTHCEGCRVYLDQLRRTVTLTTVSRDATVQISPPNFEELVAVFSRHVEEQSP